MSIIHKLTRFADGIAEKVVCVGEGIEQEVENIAKPLVYGGEINEKADDKTYPNLTNSKTLLNLAYQSPLQPNAQTLLQVTEDFDWVILAIAATGLNAGTAFGLVTPFNIALGVAFPNSASLSEAGDFILQDQSALPPGQQYLEYPVYDGPLSDSRLRLGVSPNDFGSNIGVPQYRINMLCTRQSNMAGSIAGNAIANVFVPFVPQVLTWRIYRIARQMKFQFLATAGFHRRRYANT
jgi:hypothetical protein